MAFSGLTSGKYNIVDPWYCLNLYFLRICFGSNSYFYRVTSEYLETPDILWLVNADCSDIANFTYVYEIQYDGLDSWLYL